MFMCMRITFNCAYAVHLYVLSSSGAVGARLLSGLNKPVAMDVDEEENMSESALILPIFLSVCLPV